jgi:uncharacterized membrane protein YtjA (UPF0391 family)
MLAFDCLPVEIKDSSFFIMLGKSSFLGFTGCSATMIPSVQVATLVFVSYMVMIAISSYHKLVQVTMITAGYRLSV